MKFYTWKDIDRYCLLNRNKWEQYFERIEVYPTDIYLYIKQGSQINLNAAAEALFGCNYHPGNEAVMLDLGEGFLSIHFEDAEYAWSPTPVRPQFSNVLYQHSSYPSSHLNPLTHPVIAFHSYKGGVGRTLSLLAFVKAWSAVFDDDSRRGNRLLIVDSDIEAPGLTWLKDDLSDDTLSYLDLLTLIQDNRSMDEIVDLACEKLKVSTITVETRERKVEHVFLPTYRYEQQLLDLYATPESIIKRKEKEYILAEVLDRICSRLNLCAAVVDLRAGISEYSSSLLLDPRVKKYLVTSTSTQSIRGTQTLLKYLMNGLSIDESAILPEIFLNMIPDSLPDSEKEKITSELLYFYDQRVQDDDTPYFAGNVITELPFASELIHLTSVDQIFQSLTDRGLYLKIENLIQQNYFELLTPKESTDTEGSNAEILSQINHLASAQLTAEGNSSFDVLVTAPLKYLSRRYNSTLPTVVMMGAKGAGKTFLYRKMLEARDWKSFGHTLNEEIDNKAAGYFLPVIATKNSGEMIGTLQGCIKALNSSVPAARADESVFLDNRTCLDSQKGVKTDWMRFWQKMLASSINPAWKDLDEANKNLDECGKKVIFLIDGLEDILTQVSKEEQEQLAVRILCQEIVTEIIARYRNLGIIIFIRRDMARSAIQVNFKQFEQSNGFAELKWSPAEALRLVVWLISKTDCAFYKGPKEVYRASQAVIDANLTRLWGLKLGKSTSNEAYSSRWILAALSDFNGQLQARDIIRFLKFASVPPKKVTYTDRIIMPAEIRTAVIRCSMEKTEEVKQEYTDLQPIFEKLDQLPPEQKLLPLSPSHAVLNSEEELHMIEEGYLKRDNDKYYLPEIIRHALGFKYERGARPKVLSLTIK